MQSSPFAFIFFVKYIYSFEMHLFTKYEPSPRAGIGDAEKMRSDCPTQGALTEHGRSTTSPTLCTVLRVMRMLWGQTPLSTQEIGKTMALETQASARLGCNRLVPCLGSVDFQQEAVHTPEGCKSAAE